MIKNLSTEISRRLCVVRRRPNFITSTVRVDVRLLSQLPERVGNDFFDTGPDLFRVVVRIDRDLDAVNIPGIIQPKLNRDFARGEILVGLLPLQEFSQVTHNRLPGLVGQHHNGTILGVNRARVLQIVGQFVHVLH